MAQITINEISANYGYNVGTSSFATVALPITAQWGPGFFASTDELLSMGDYDSKESKYCNYMSNVKWDKFEATSQGMEAFLRSYRGPAANFKSAQDYSYHQALTLLNAGYDVLVCRISPGQPAYQSYDTYTIDGKNITIKDKGVISLRAKYPGTFGNNLFVEFRKRNKTTSIFNIIIYTKDASGVKTTLENNVCTFNYDEATDFIPYYREIESAFIDAFVPDNDIVIDSDTYIGTIQKDKVVISHFDGGTDREIPTYDAITTAVTSGALVTKHKTINTKSLDGLVDSDTLTIRVHASANTITTLKIEDANKSSGTYQAVPVVAGTAPDGTSIPLKADKDAIITVKFRKSDGKFVVTSNKSPKDIGKDVFRLALARYANSYEPSNQEGYEFNPQNSDFYTDEDYTEIDETNTKTVRYLAQIFANTGKPNVNDDGTVTANEAPIWSIDKLSNVLYREWLFTASVGTSYYKQNTSDYEPTNYDTGVYALIKDKLKYNPQRVISPGWDDQDILYLDDILYLEDAESLEQEPIGFNFISPIHVRLMDVGYWARCTAALLDIPRSISRCKVYIEGGENIAAGYAQKIARNAVYGEIFDASVTDVGLYPTHSALFAPWGQYKYVKTSKMNMASPAFLALMIHRAQLKGQPDQYEWLLPRNRVHNLNIGKMDYTIPKKLMDMWQSLSGVGVNIITDIPGLGINLWGNSTLYEVPEATYQALANLSTRYLVNAIENIAYTTGVSITYTYNNNQAYEQFYAGVTPLLDTMKNLGAIVDYYVKMEADINGLDRINANSIIGKIYITPVGVVNDITVDLVALPPNTDLTEIKAG